MNHITELRQLSGIETITKLADVLDVGISTISQIESGSRKPSLKLASKMKQLFSCTYDDIFLPYNFANSEINKETCSICRNLSHQEDVDGTEILVCGLSGDRIEDADTESCDEWEEDFAI